MSFDSQVAASLRLKLNLVMKVTTPADGDVYFSKHPVDSGLAMDADKVGVIDSFSVPGTQIDIQTARQDVGSATVTLVDKDGVFTAFMGGTTNTIVGYSVTLYVGLLNKSMPFSDYVIEKQDYIVKTIDWSAGKYSLGLRSPADRMQIPIYNFRANVAIDMGIPDDTVTIQTGSDTFKDASEISPQRAKIGDEFVQYTGKSYLAGYTVLQDVSRGDLSSTTEEHKIGAEVWFVEKVQANPINILLQLLTSTGAGTNGAYDVLFDGIGIPLDQIDVDTFLDIRDTFFASDSFTLYLYKIPDALEYIENELLLANNLRFTEVDGRLSIAILDQSIPGEALPIVDEDVIVRNPSPGWKLTENRLVNEVTIEYLYDEGAGVYAKTLTVSDLKSQKVHGYRPSENLRFKGITLAAVAKDRATRFLNRFSTPQTEISVSQFLSTYKTPPGNKVKFTLSDMPGPGGTGVKSELELLKKAINYATGLVQATYVFTSYVNFRRGLIAPSPLVLAVEYPFGGATYRIDPKYRDTYQNSWLLYVCDAVTGARISGPWETAGNTNFDPDLLIFYAGDIGAIPGLHTLRFADYDECFEGNGQREKYAFICGSTGLFADGSGGYKIY